MTSLLLLDDRIFTPHGWFAIDEHNRRVPRLKVPSLTAGLAMIGTRVRAVVGQLRPGFLAVDVDLPDWQGHAATERIAHWAETQGLWTLVRPSGGDEGRHHIIVAVGTTGEGDNALLTFVEELRSTYGCSRTQIDVRRALRALSSPHRTQPHSRGPYGRLRELLSTCPQYPDTHAPAPTPPIALHTPLTPRPRRHTALPQAWAHYLDTGQLPAIEGDQSRSTYEAITTSHMVRCGWSIDEAWYAITTAHPHAMTRARRNKRRWIAWVWNPAVVDNETTLGTRSRIDDVVRHSVARGRTVLTSIAWTLPPRQRPALLNVGHTLLDRIERTQTLRVPCPERDLVLDTGIHSRRVIRHALKTLAGCGLGTLHTDSLNPLDAMTSFEFEIEPVPSEQWEKYPPSRHTPAAALPGTWQTLPRTARQVLTALTIHGPLSPTDLAVTAQLTPTPASTPSESTLRTLTSTLTALHHAGLATVDDTGTWQAGAIASSDWPTIHQHRAHATRSYTRVHERIQAERTAWRTHALTRWASERTVALRTNAQREHTWWNSLDPFERAQRTAHWRSKFDALSLDEQHQTKQRLAQRRQRAGLDELERYTRWRASVPAPTWQERSVLRARRFQQLSGPEQMHSVALWRAHRTRWALPDPTTTGTTRTEIDTRHSA